MRLLYGTTNPARLQHMKEMLSLLDIDIIGPKGIGLKSVDVDESGNDPLENARAKALAYFDIAKIPVFSCDSGLYIDGLSPKEQPGVHVRRVNGQHLDDSEMIEYYSNIARRYGGEVTARYRNAICLVIDEKTVYQYGGDDIASTKFIITAKPHSARVEGFPLDSLSVEIDTRRYYLDLKKKERSQSEDTSSVAAGFRKFFLRTVSGVTSDFQHQDA